MNEVRVAMIGDIFGSPGREAVQKLLPKFIREHKVDFVIANGENSAGGLGITPEIARFLFDRGVDVITTGNHVFNHKQIFPYFEKEHRLLRPGNMGTDRPGRGTVVVEKKGLMYGVVNMMGKVFMDNELESPFLHIRRVLELMHPRPKLIFVDFHAEATSEKVAMGYFLDGEVTAVVGTHTHVPTADGRILPKGTAFQTDIGMTGPIDSVIGVTIEKALARFVGQKTARFTAAKGAALMDVCLICADTSTGKATSHRHFRLYT